MAAEVLVDAARNSAEMLNALLITAVTLACTIVGLKLAGTRRFDFLHVTVDLKYAGLVFLLFTMAHLYLAVLFVQDIYHLFYEHPEFRTEAWEKLTTAKLLFFHGLVARTKVTTISLAGQTALLYNMSWLDATTWLVHAAALVLFAAIVQWRDVTWRRRVATTALALAIVVSNWIVGTNWIVAVSELTLDPSQSIYLSNVHAVFGGSNEQ